MHGQGGAMRIRDWGNREIRLVMWLLSVAVLLLLYANPIAAQSTGSLSGIVRDPSGAVLSGATLTLRSSRPAPTALPSPNRLASIPSPKFYLGRTS